MFSIFSKKFKEDFYLKYILKQTNTTNIATYLDYYVSYKNA